MSSDGYEVSSVFYWVFLIQMDLFALQALGLIDLSLFILMSPTLLYFTILIIGLLLFNMTGK